MGHLRGLVRDASSRRNKRYGEHSGQGMDSRAISRSELCNAAGADLGRGGSRERGKSCWSTSPGMWRTGALSNEGVWGLCWRLRQHGRMETRSSHLSERKTHKIGFRETIQQRYNPRPSRGTAYIEQSSLISSESQVEFARDVRLLHDLYRSYSSDRPFRPNTVYSPFMTPEFPYSEALR